jgi:hypothetical protein
MTKQMDCDFDRDAPPGLYNVLCSYEKLVCTWTSHAILSSGLLTNAITLTTFTRNCTTASTYCLRLGISYALIVAGFWRPYLPVAAAAGRGHRGPETAPINAFSVDSSRRFSGRPQRLAQTRP